MRRVLKALLTAALLCAAFAPSAQASFGFESLEMSFNDAEGLPAMAAGSHPFAMRTAFDFNVDEAGNPEDSPKDLEVDLPPGLVANPTAVPRCSNLDFLTLHDFSPEVERVPSCPDSTAVGFVGVRSPHEATAKDFAVVYNLTPAPGSALKLGFRALKAFVTVSGGVRADAPNNAFATVQNIQQIVPFVGSELTLWGNPASPAHDGERGSCIFTDEECPVELPVKPFLTLPRSCQGPLQATFKMRSWVDPATWVEGKATTPEGVFGCGELDFAPKVSAKPTATQAESSSGLDFGIDINDEGLISSEGAPAQSDVKKAVVTMPEGMTVNPSAAEGLVGCSIAGFAAERVDSPPGAGCPQASKVGDVEVESPLLEGELLRGQIFVADQDQNLVHSLIALYMVIKDPELGIMVKLPGKVETDPRSGRLTTTFGEAPYEIPQVPFSHFRFHFHGGERAPLITPPRCGPYTTQITFTPWANPDRPFNTSADFSVGSGANGGPCPSGPAPFKPSFSAGSLNNAAGAYSPFQMRLRRGDSEQELTRFAATLPSGVFAKLAGVGKCPDISIAVAANKSGHQELASPSCPPSSLVGHVSGGAGVGSALTYVPGSVYLAGPYKGDPLSAVASVPALAGPFDLGTVLTRVGLTLNPITYLAEINSAGLDAIPHILKGIPLKLRDLIVSADRPDFTLNPTSCDREATQATLFGSAADPFDPADDVGVSLASPYQAADCARLGFKPKLSLTLKGGTKRGGHPALKSVLTYPKGPGYANVGKAVVSLPPTELIDNAHIQNPCTRVQFNADQCPKGSLLGTAKATSPLLDEPLQGPVYFRSNGGERQLPDIVADLHGLIDVVLVGEVDSVKARIRTTFRHVPDAPVTKFTLDLYGGKKGLLVNNRDLCAHQTKAKIDFTAQSGKTHNTNLPVANSCAKKGKGKKPKH